MKTTCTAANTHTETKHENKVIIFWADPFGSSDTASEKNVLHRFFTVMDRKLINSGLKHKVVNDNFTSSAVPRNLIFSDAN